MWLAVWPAAATSGSREPAWTKVELRDGDVGGDGVFIRLLLQEVRAECRSCVEIPGREFTIDNFGIGRFDLDNDGIDELFVTYIHAAQCGTAGCPTKIFQLQAGAWVQIGSTFSEASYDPDRDVANPYSIYVLDEWTNGYRTIVGVDHSFRWGTLEGRPYYGEMSCASERCFREEAEQAAAERRAAKRKARD
jgi:hypothetical protein